MEKAEKLGCDSEIIYFPLYDKKTHSQWLEIIREPSLNKVLNYVRTESIWFIPIKIGAKYIANASNFA